MSKIFIIHGSYGNPQENWFPWLKEELRKKGHEVFVPKFPTPENQSLETWTKEFEEYIPLIDEDTIFVGHSLGPAFILSVLEKLGVKIKACFFVSGFLGPTGNPDFDNINNSFTEKEFDWDKIKSICPRFKMYHSDNDPYLLIGKAKKLSSSLGIEIEIIKGAGHFNESAGYTQFPKLLEDIISTPR